MPELWLRRLRTVIRGSRPSRSGRCSPAGASSSTAPESTSCITAVAVAILVIENQRKAVSGSTGACVEGDAMPLSPCHPTPSGPTSAAVAPGAPTAWSRSPTASPN